MAAPAILNIHTPTSSFAIVHSLTQDSLTSLYDKLSRKAHTDYHGERVGPGWLKYEYNDSIWNLDDESDYTIFIWRQQQELGVIPPSAPSSYTPSNASTSFIPLPGPSRSGFASPVSTNSTYRTHHSNALNGFYQNNGIDRPTPALYLHNPNQPLPEPPAYRNASFYLFRPSRAISPDPLLHNSSGKAKSIRSTKTKRSVNGDETTSGKGKALADVARAHQEQLKKKFEKFHGENGVRTVIGSIGPVQNVRMLLKSGYRHVYVSRKFAIKHAFIPSDSALGQHGYVGLVSIGTWPITVMPIASSSSASSSPTPTMNRRSLPASPQPRPGSKPTMVTVYLSEEPHFDVVLGRSFFEKRQIQINGADPTEVVCLDTGERLECELVILKDGRGEFITVT